MLMSNKHLISRTRARKCGHTTLLTQMAEKMSESCETSLFWTAEEIPDRSRALGAVVRGS